MFPVHLMQHTDHSDEDDFDQYDKVYGDKNDDSADKAMVTDEVGRVDDQSDVAVRADH